MCNYGMATIETQMTGKHHFYMQISLDMKLKIQLLRDKNFTHVLYASKVGLERMFERSVHLFVRSTFEGTN